MANQKISQLDAAGTLDGSELLVVVQAGDNFKLTITSLVAYLDASMIAFSSATGSLAATTVEDALRELADEVLQLDADAVSFSSSTGGLASVTVGGALRELQDELSGHLSSASAHQAEDVVFGSSTGLLLATNVRDAIFELADEMQRRGDPVELPSYTVATLPDISTGWTPALIYVSDESGGAVPAFSDGANWRRVTDRAIVT